MRLLAESFDNLAAAMDVAREISSGAALEPAQVRAILEIVAECQSALRLLVLEKTTYSEDGDQLLAFGWLRDATYEQHEFVERHMRLDDPADPDAWADRAYRVHQLQGQFAARREHARQLEDAWKRLRWHTKQVAQLGQEHSRDDWKRVFATVDDLIEHGVKASDVNLRTALLPILEQRPLDVPTSRGWQMALDEIDRYLAGQERDAPQPSIAKEPLEHVRKAAELLRGARVVLIGGHERVQSKQALIRELRLAELEWITAPEHSSLEVFAPAIMRSETLLVLLLIRWSSHAYEELSDLCAKHGKVFVRIPGGYSPSSIAHQVLEQASDRLKAARPGF